MATLAMQSSLSDLHGFIAKVRGYPVSVRQLIKFARDSQAPKDVIKFYETFDDDQVFKDKDDLTSRSEQVEIMREESGEMPREEERSPEEY